MTKTAMRAKGRHKLKEQIPKTRRERLRDPGTTTLKTTWVKNIKCLRVTLTQEKGGMWVGVPRLHQQKKREPMTMSYRSWYKTKKNRQSPGLTIGKRKNIKLHRKDGTQLENAGDREVRGWIIVVRGRTK